MVVTELGRGLRGDEIEEGICNTRQSVRAVLKLCSEFPLS